MEEKPKTIAEMIKEAGIELKVTDEFMTSQPDKNPEFFDIYAVDVKKLLGI